jgi:hypothetical protein
LRKMKKNKQEIKNGYLWEAENGMGNREESEF